MNANKRLVWITIALWLVVGLDVFDRVQLLSPAMMVKWVLIGMVLIALGMLIGSRMKKTYAIMNTNKWRISVIIGVIGVGLVVGVGAPLQLLGPKMVVEGFLMGMALIALGISIGIIYKHKAEID